MAAPVLVTGGTGTLGRLVTPLLRASGHQVRVLSRRAREGTVPGDLLRDEGIDAAVDGTELILHLAGGPKGDDVATANLLRAAKAAGTKHLIYISVTAADALPIGYFRAKAAAEEAIVRSGVPYSTLRAAQFHEFALGVVRTLAKSPVLPVFGGMRLQPVDTADVAARLVELTAGDPAGRVADLVGPKVYGLRELATGYLHAAHKHRALLPVRIPGRIGRLYREGANLSLEGATFGTGTWEQFLAERFRQS